MKIAIAQTNPRIGDLTNNFLKIESFTQKAIDKGSDLIVFPELALCGYPPLDLLEKEAFVQKNLDYIDKIKSLSKNIGILIGCITRNIVENINDHNSNLSQKWKIAGKIDVIGTNIFNSALLFYENKLLHKHDKTLLPNYDVFDEVRYFKSAKSVSVSEFKGIRLGVSICEDAWNDKEFWKHRLYQDDPLEKINELKTDLLINLSASPFSVGKEKIKLKMFSSLAAKYKKRLIQVNQVGGNTDLIFDGASKVFDEKGNLILALKSFEEDLQIFDTLHNYEPFNYEPKTDIESIFNALVSGIRDYFTKSCFKKAVIGLSGGIDSAIVATLATYALGKENVLCLMMPSQFSSTGSINDSQKLIENLGINGNIIAINNLFETFKSELSQFFLNLKEDITEENIQARIRGVLLMAFSNKYGYLVLSTGNKSETAVGYSTLYGDMCGGLAVISDLYKTTVYELADYINRKEDIIPYSIIKKAPSAELRPNQTDQDTLPPYDILDKILRYYLEYFYEEEEIIKLGFDSAIVKKVLQMVDYNEYKRKQAPPGLKVTSKAFGIGRRYPIVQGWR